MPANLPPDYTIARVGVERVADIATQRRAMFVDMGHHDEAALDRMSAAFRPWVTAKLASREYVARARSSRPRWIGRHRTPFDV